MARTQEQDRVLALLQGLDSVDKLKSLFQRELSYERVNQPISTRDWDAAARAPLADDPLIFAAQEQGGDFHLIYVRLDSDHLLLTDERPVIERLLRDHDRALFVFSNRQQNRWHFVNVKVRGKQRPVLRRITVEPRGSLRTACERITMLDLAPLTGGRFIAPAAAAIQQKHDEAFDVERVTRKFFEQYRKVFGEVKGEITGISDDRQKQMFTQRLFNRLMFIAFIQKKGWLKLPGDGDYLSNLWAAYYKPGEDNGNFYAERLKLLFFSGLNNKGGQDVRAGLLGLIGEVPYLNGGLFEEETDDRDPTITVPDAAIVAILSDLFAGFNFTVTESTPLDIEVAVDPEMLGKVFEELVTGRHESGSYYTPKPIVSFMGREALKGYLAHKLPGEDAATIARFVDEQQAEGLRDGEAVLAALQNVRVCDPACGSGAYLLGMMQELLLLRAALSAAKNVDSINVYKRKLQIIQQNLYGVDLDPFAVNIARLRLWLSLAVDFEGQKPEPLPNLDFKIEVGDSLTAPDPSGGLGVDMFRREQINRYFALKSEYLGAHSERKRTLVAEIEAVRAEIRGWAHPGGVGDGFDWQVEFAEVFDDGGFDIVLANPPYVKQGLISGKKNVLEKVYPTVYNGSADLYTYFYARALHLLRPQGLLAFISSNKWFRTGYGLNLRKYIADNAKVLSITDFGELPVFKAAATFPMIFIAQKGNGANTTVFTQVKSLNEPYPDVLAVTKSYGYVLPHNAIQGSNWQLTTAENIDRVSKLEAAGVPFGEYVGGKIYVGLKTGFNKAFWLDDAKRAALIAQDQRSAEIIKPLVKGDDVRKWRIANRDKWLIYAPWSLNIDNYPAVKAHLSQWRRELEARPECAAGRYNWWCLSRYASDYIREFDKPKILYPDIARESRFTLDTSGTYVDMTAFVVPVDNLYLLGVLNTSIVWYYLQQKASVLGDADEGGRMSLKRFYIEKIPIPAAPAAEQEAISRLVQACLDARGVGVAAQEAEIDERVARLYGLTAAELAAIKR